MPAAAVIPAPVAYIKVVAVKKLVVELRAWRAGPSNGRALRRPGLSFWETVMQLIQCCREPGLLL